MKRYKYYVFCETCGTDLYGSNITNLRGKLVESKDYTSLSNKHPNPKPNDPIECYLCGSPNLKLR